MKHYNFFVILFFIFIQASLKSSAQVTTIFEDHFNDTSSANNWHHTKDYRGGAFFYVIDGKFTRVPDGGHVFYYNNSFEAGSAIYEFKAKGWWVFLWRGTTNPEGGRVVLIGNGGNGYLGYDESIWWPLEGGEYNYHNGIIYRTNSVYVGDKITSDLNTYRIMDDGKHAMIFMNGQPVLNVTINPEWRNSGYIEIGANHLNDKTLFDDVIVTTYFNPSPYISSVLDVPNDQGGKVSLFWTRSYCDTNISTLPYYSIWRAIPHEDFAKLDFTQRISITSDFSLPKYRITSSDGKNYFWEWVANQPAHKFHEYSYSAPTLFDSMSTTNGKHYFLISAHTNNPDIFYDSNIDSGYSVDNLSPDAPKNFKAEYINGYVVLHWNNNSESDLKGYDLYRGISDDELTFLTFTADTSFIDMNPGMNNKYAIAAKDVHDNESKIISFNLTDIINSENKPTEFVLFQNYPNPFNPSTSIKYGLSSQSYVRLEIYNVLGEKIVTLIDAEQPANYYSIEWKADVPSGMYFYRLEAIDINNPSKKFIDTKKMLLVR